LRHPTESATGYWVEHPYKSHRAGPLLCDICCRPASCPTLTEQPFTEAEDPLPPTIRLTLSLRPPSSRGTPKRSSICDAHGARYDFQESAALILTTFTLPLQGPTEEAVLHKRLLILKHDGLRTASLPLYV